MLLTVTRLGKRVTAREVPRAGRTDRIVGVDLGGGRAWSAAVAAVPERKG